MSRAFSTHGSGTLSTLAIRTGRLAAALGALAALALASGTTQARGSQPPTFETTAATSVTPGSATLNAKVNPNGSEVGECQFEYGPTVLYGSISPCSPSPGSGTSPVAVAAAVTGLSPHVTYHFRVSASNAGGTSRGADEAFTTPPSYLSSITHYEDPEIKLRSPNAVALDPAGNLFVAEPGASHVLEFNPERKYLRQIGEAGSGPGQLQGIGGIATNSSGDLYVADPGNYRVQDSAPPGNTCAR